MLRTSGAVSLSEKQISECWQQMTAMNYFLFLLVGGKAPFQQELQAGNSPVARAPVCLPENLEFCFCLPTV